MSGTPDAPGGTVAIVTGGARGIGAAIAIRLAEDGHDVAVVDLDKAACAATLEAISARGRRGCAVVADVADEGAVKAAVAEVAERLGPPLVLVNNAGILRDRSLAKMTVDDWDSVVRVNLRSVFLMCREVLPFMRAASWGRIVNLSSTAALGERGESSYSAAKAGVQGVTRTLAIELGRYGVTVNAVAPGFVVTEMTRAVAERLDMPFEDMVAEMLKAVHVGRVGAPEDIAHSVAFFVDRRSSFVTGQILYVAGAPRG